MHQIGELIVHAIDRVHCLSAVNQTWPSAREVVPRCSLLNCLSAFVIPVSASPSMEGVHGGRLAHPFDSNLCSQVIAVYAAMREAGQTRLKWYL